MLGVPSQLDVLAPENSNKNTVGASDKETGQILVSHTIRDRLQSSARSDRPRPRRHCLLNTHTLVFTNRATTQQPENDAFIVDDDAKVPVCRQACGYLCDLLVEPTRGRAGTDDASGASAAVVAALERKSERAPIGLTCGVVVDVCEAERFEPRRGPRAQVSLVVVAVGDHRPLPVEVPGRVHI